jgi:glycerol-3-phosphate dehydrogenase (NAD(P)+)
MSRIGVFGAGAFGTALAITLARAGNSVTLWGRDPDARQSMRMQRENHRRLPGIRFPKNLALGDTVDATLADINLLVVPTQALGAFLAEHSVLLQDQTLITCCKGIDLKTGLGPTELISQVAPSARTAVLTGPSFADDIAAGLPTALALAASDTSLGAQLQSELSGPTLRLYLSDDPVGAELGGALKNVIALAAGLTIGSGHGESARAAVMTRGFAEMQRLALAMGAKPETLSGLSGLGDLILTCTSEKSRNFSAGLALGRGDAPRSDTTIEGLATANAVAKLSKTHGIDMPITAMVSAVVNGNMPLEAARDALLARPLRKE